MARKEKPISRKRPTQVELERENSDLKKQVTQLQKRLKQALRQLRNHEEIDVDNRIALDLEAEASFNDMLAGKKPEDDKDTNYIVVTLPNGQTKQIRKRVANE